MALKKTLTIGSLFAIFASGGFANFADAQQARLNTPSATFEHRAIEMPDNTGPLATPGAFHYDAQMFAPVEFTNDKQLEPNSGFFFSVEKVLTSLSLPSQLGTGLPTAPLGGEVIIGGQIDDDTGEIVGGFLTEFRLPTGDLRNVVPSGDSWTWGERYSFGWMSEHDHGWEGTFQDVSGAIVFRTRTADLNLDGLPDRDNSFSTLEQTLGTTYRVGELNRIFRQVLKNGDTFEPYLGGRYTQLNDENDDRFQIGITPADLNGNGTIEAPDEDLIVESQLRHIVTNSALGFQLGGRHRRRRGRFMFTTDGSVAASYNQQRYSVENFNVVDRGGADDDGEVQGALVASTDEYFADSTFVPSIDLEYAMSYNVTRDVTIRLGSNINYLWQNVARANTRENVLNPNYNGFDYFNELSLYAITPAAFEAGDFFDNGEEGLFSNSFIAAGFTFGVEWRR